MTPSQQLRDQAVALLKLADELDAAPAPSAPAERGTISLKEAAFLARRSESTLRRWLKKYPELGFQSRASDEWHVRKRVLLHLLASEHDESGGDSGGFGG